MWCILHSFARPIFLHWFQSRIRKWSRKKALELVSRADFWCILHYFFEPDLSMQVAAPNDPKFGQFFELGPCTMLNERRRAELTMSHRIKLIQRHVVNSARRRATSPKFDWSTSSLKACCGVGALPAAPSMVGTVELRGVRTLGAA